MTNCEIGDLVATKIGNVLVTYVDGEAIVDQSGEVTIDTNDDPDEDAFFRLDALEVHGS